MDSDGSDGEHETLPQISYPVGEEVEVPGTNGMLFKKVLVEGTPSTRPPHGSKVSVHYVGTLASDGSKFDSSRDRGDLFEFDIGKGSVIKGWDKGVATMNKGEKAILKCLPEYAYGAGGSPPKIPPNSTLNFEVELFDWSNETDISAAHDKSLMKQTLKEGEKYDKPAYESVVVVNVTTKSDEGTILLQKVDWSFVIGEEDNLPAFLEDSIKSMKLNEEAIVHSKKAKLTHSITLKSFTKVNTWEVKGKDKLKEAQVRREQGNTYFKAGKWEAAAQKYKRALEFVSSKHDLNDEEKAEISKIEVALNGNLTQVYLNLKNFTEAISTAGKVLEIEHNNVKALYRRGKAHALLDNWDEAKRDLTAVLQSDPTNADAKQELNALNEKIAAHNNKEKKLFSKMFA